MTPEHQESLPDFPDPSVGFLSDEVAEGWAVCCGRDASKGSQTWHLQSHLCPLCLFLGSYLVSPEDLGIAGQALSLSCLPSVLFPPSVKLLPKDPLLGLRDFLPKSSCCCFDELPGMSCFVLKFFPKNRHKLLLWHVPVLSLNSSPTGNPFILLNFHLESYNGLRDTQESLCWTLCKSCWTSGDLFFFFNSAGDATAAKNSTKFWPAHGFFGWPSCCQHPLAQNLCECRVREKFGLINSSLIFPALQDKGAFTSCTWEHQDFKIKFKWSNQGKI